MTIPVAIVTEDIVSEEVIRKILLESTQDFFIHASFGGSGFGFIKANTDRFINASNAIAHIVLTDQDNHSCAPSLISSWFKKPIPQNLLFRVATREVESWILADRGNFCSFSGISITKIPSNPDELSDPKQSLINLFRGSRYKRLASEIVPKAGAVASIGVGYNENICKFIRDQWNPISAATNSPSLSKAISRINSFSPKI